MSSPPSPRNALRPLLTTALSLLALGLLAFTSTPVRAELLVGTSETDITPPLPVALAGQFRLRVAKEVESPVTASVVVLEKTDAEGNSVDHAVMVACDLVTIRGGARPAIRAAIGERNLAGLDPKRLFVSATHTHTAPVMRQEGYRIPEDVTQPGEFVRFLADQVADAIADAWKTRAPGSVGWGLGHAVVAHNRRATYLDGRAQMYGSTSSTDFKGLEGGSDHGVETLLFWEAGGKADAPLAVAVNVACPAQVVEGRSNLNADYWHEVRRDLKEIYGERLVVLGWIGAAGDQVPRPMLRKKAERRMLEARGLTRMEEISRRITAAVEGAWLAAKDDRHGDPVLEHRVAELALPKRIVTEEEVASARAEIGKIRAGTAEEIARNTRRWLWHQRTVDRYAEQDDDADLPMEMHALRLGDIAICTNRFELFTEYGNRIKGRSKALQTFVVQLAGAGTYLATEEAEAGGGYSAIVNSCEVGPAGGKVLVDRTVEAINAMWE